MRTYITIEEKPSASFLLTIKNLDCQTSTHCQEAFGQSGGFPIAMEVGMAFTKHTCGDETSTYLNTN